MAAPATTYRTLAAASTSPRAVTGALARVAVPAIVAGIATAVSATGRISWRLALSGAVCWTLIAVLQLLTALVVIRPSASRVGFWRGLELFFAGHAAWSLWLIGAAAFAVAAPDAVSLDPLLASALIPFVWTAVITYGFCRGVLGLPRRAAVLRTGLHVALTFGVMLLYVGWAIAIWPRVIGLHAS